MTAIPTPTPTPTSLAEVIDLDRYPLDRLDGPRGAAMVAFCRAALAFEGACQLPGFVRPEAVRQLVDEAHRSRPRAHRTDDTHNVYFEDVPRAAGPGDVLALRQHSSKSAIAWDLVDAASPLRLAYESDELTRFLAQALDTELHRYDDPLGSASLMVFEEGDELGWHFDRSPFAVTLMLQPAGRGGAYEYHQDLRDADTDGIGDADGAVRAVLQGDTAGRITLPAEPGTLSLFRGRRSLHRVTPVEGDRVRINAVLAYSARAGDRLNALTRELFYGRRP